LVDSVENKLQYFIKNNGYEALCNTAQNTVFIGQNEVRLALNF